MSGRTNIRPMTAAGGTGSTGGTGAARAETPRSAESPETTGGPIPDHPIPYQYFVLRAVPRPEREEFVNVGVVVYSEELDTILLGWHVDEPRLRALDPSVDVETLRGALEHLADLARPGSSAGMARPRRRGALFGWLAAPRSSVLQPGPTHGGVVSRPGDRAGGTEDAGGTGGTGGTDGPTLLAGRLETLMDRQVRLAACR